MRQRIGANTLPHAGLLPVLLLASATFHLVPAPLAAGVGGSLAQSDTVGLRATLQASLDAIHEGGSHAGTSAAVALPDGSTIAVAAGYSDSTRHIPMQTSDRLMSGSVGKTYFAALAMQLVSEGRLDLDASVSEYLGDLPWFARIPNASAITIRNLMNHTSGVMRYEFQEAFTRDLFANPDKFWEPEELLSYIFDMDPSFAAGEGWEYSDTNYIILAMILEEITGRACYDEIRTRILEPLGLRNTVPTNTRTVPGLVQGYAGPNNIFGDFDEVILPDGRFAINPQFEWAGGGYAFTTEDLARWAWLLYEGRAFDPALLDEVLDGVPAQLGPGARYGLGVIIVDTPLGVSYGHSGYFPGYLTQMMYFPEHHIAVAVQVNTSDQRAVGRGLGSIIMELAQEIMG
jgi:D-alanyl-D-alanine carboxypeptidase